MQRVKSMNSLALVHELILAIKHDLYALYEV